MFLEKDKSKVQMWEKEGQANHVAHFEDMEQAKAFYKNKQGEFVAYVDEENAPKTTPVKVFKLFLN